MANKFFVSKEVFKDRIDICRKCEYYFKPTGNCKVCGCFMRIKASISVMECPKGYWLATEIVDKSVDIPEHLLQEVRDIAPHIQNGKAKDIETKTKLIELYNVIYNGNYSTSSNCGSCLHTVYKGIKIIIDDLQ